MTSNKDKEIDPMLLFKLCPPRRKVYNINIGELMNPEPKDNEQEEQEYDEFGIPYL